MKELWIFLALKRIFGAVQVAGTIFYAILGAPLDTYISRKINVFQVGLSPLQF